MSLFARLRQRLSDVFHENTSVSRTLLELAAQGTHSHNVFKGNCSGSYPLLDVAAHATHSHNVFQGNCSGSYKLMGLVAHATHSHNAFQDNVCLSLTLKENVSRTKPAQAIVLGNKAILTGVDEKNVPGRFKMLVGVFTLVSFNNVAVLVWDRSGPSTKTSLFGSDPAMLKSTLYLGKGGLHIGWLLAFLPGDFFRKHR